MRKHNDDLRLRHIYDDNYEEVASWIPEYRRWWGPNGLLQQDQKIRVHFINKCPFKGINNKYVFDATDQWKEKSGKV